MNFTDDSSAPRNLALITGGKKSVVEALAELLKGTDVAKHLDSLAAKGK